jgi:hypothetical protein
MPSIDGAQIHCIHQDMSRPIHFLLPAVFLASALVFTGCVGTIYDRTYSYKKNHFRPPEEKKEVSAETILGALDKKPDAGADAAALPDVPVPGLPPAGLPPAAPDAAIPGLPPPAAPAAPPPAK